MMKKFTAIIIALVVGAALFWFVKSGSPSATETKTPTTTAPVTSSTSGASTSAAASYKDGTYTGSTVSTRYGDVQVAAVISGGKITDVKFLAAPYEEGRSQEISAYAEPNLKSETLSAQSANVDAISGATSTSDAYVESMQSALSQAS